MGYNSEIYIEKKKGAAKKPVPPKPGTKRPIVPAKKAEEEDEEEPNILPFVKINLHVSRHFYTLEETVMLHFIILSSILHEKKRQDNYKGKGYYWAVFSKASFHKSYKCISVCKLKTALQKLVKAEYIIKDVIYKNNLSQARWYRPNYEKLERIEFSKEICLKFFHNMSS